MWRCWCCHRIDGGAKSPHTGFNAVPGAGKAAPMVGSCFSFPSGFRFAFPFLPGAGSGKEEIGTITTRGRKTLPKSQFLELSTRPLNARSRLGAQPTAEGDKPKSFTPPCPQNTKRRRGARAGRATAAQAEPGGHAAAGALPAVRNHAPQGSDPAQIPNYFLLQCRECILDGGFFLQLSPGKNISPCAYRRHCRRQLSQARGEVWGLANKGPLV